MKTLDREKNTAMSALRILVCVLVLCLGSKAGAAQEGAPAPEQGAARHATVPLKSLRELAAWTPATAPWNRASEPLRRKASPDNPLADLWLPRAPRQSGKGRVIVMHDMGGGYLPDQDRYPDGTRNDRLYRFTHWQYVDTFIYFTHARVSFPPPGWTDSAHRNGVRSLGTFIIEDGADSDSELSDLLDSAKRRRAYARKLAVLAKSYGFDGWLVNIEVSLSNDARQATERARSLRDFVSELRSASRERDPQSQVIWYDSIVRTGEVAYQNELNDKNKMFFARASGITVNYDWSPPVDDGSPKTSARVAGQRAPKVYSSVDAFCRKDQGQNRRYCAFRSYQGAGPAFHAGTSFGVFAPAWTYEGEGAAPDHGNFPQRDARFWVGTGGEKRPEKGVAEFVAARPIPSDLPFKTHFDQGFGTALYRRGELVTSGPWGNVGKVDVLPTWLDVAVSGSGNYDAGLTTEAAFTGGSSFRVSASGMPAGYSLRPLFRTFFRQATLLTCAVREDGLDAALVVVAADEDRPDKPLVLVLLPPGRNAPPPNVDYGLPAARGAEAVAPSVLENAAGWSRRSYDLSRLLADRTIGAIGLLAYPAAEARSGASLLLGEVSVR